MLKTEAIQNFLHKRTLKDLASLYNPDMEVQVNVAQGLGDHVEGEYKGRKWRGYSDGLTTWKGFRIPWGANSDPNYTDSDIKFDLMQHVEGIGLTGWDWKNRMSRWVGYDFDSMINHKVGLTSLELEKIVESLRSIDWVEIRRSTSGTGYHVYVYIDVPTQNHSEHAALARAILGQLSGLTGQHFESSVDACGGIMWVWHRKMQGTQGLTKIKDGSKLLDIPKNWKDHIKVITGSRRKNLPQDIAKQSDAGSFEALSGQRNIVELDDEHKALINWLKDNDCLWWWDADHHMLVAHTFDVKEASLALNMRGFFDTVSEGGDRNEQNCYGFPMRKGAWTIRRYTVGVQEHESWHQDVNGWTKCYLNRDPDLWTACRAYGGLESEKGWFVFNEVEMAINAAKLLGVIITIDRKLYARKCTLKRHKDGRLIMSVDAEDREHLESSEMEGWLDDKKKYTQVFNVHVAKTVESEIGSYDDIVRHLVTSSSEDKGWYLLSDGSWRDEPMAHVKLALKSQGIPSIEIDNILGSSIFKPWKVVNKPFQEEYPGDREWNLKSAQLKFARKDKDSELNYPHWDKILRHCGSGLNEAVELDAWCKVNNVLTGADYLKYWIASMFQKPMEPLPYLFFYGPQDSGKSIFHESISLLLTSGYQKADLALTSQNGFNGELEGAILCVVEEVDLSKSGTAYNRIKDWVTSPQLNVRPLHRNPFHVNNSTHWVQCANHASFCPVLPGDTRITMSYVEALAPINMIPKPDLLVKLVKEAPDFITDMLTLQIPPSNSRLHIPVVQTTAKVMMQESNRSELEAFIGEMCEYKPGGWLLFADFYDKFIEWIDPNEIGKWSRIAVGKQLNNIEPYIKGRAKNGKHHIGNIFWKGASSEQLTANGYIPQHRYILRGEFLVAIQD